jgi:arylsulfatase A
VSLGKIFFFERRFPAMSTSLTRQLPSQRFVHFAALAVAHRGILIFAAAMAGLLSVGHATANEPAQRPNIVLIVADDLGWADVGCYGADLHETPHLDRLAAGSLRFTNAYAAAPVCTPTRAALMTGKHPARLHMTIWREAALEPPQDQKLIPPIVERDLNYADRTTAEVLHDAGYLTAHIGKWHLGGAQHFPESHGFDVNIGGNVWGAPATHFFPYRLPGNRERRYVPGVELGHEGEYLADRLTDEAIRVIDRAGVQQFFLNLWHYGVHTPIEAPAADVEYFRAKLQPGFNHQNPTYAAMVKNLDDNVGRLLRHLDEKGIAANTVVMFTSDNGGYIHSFRKQPDVPVTNNTPLRAGKGTLYEGGIRVPLLIRWPGHTPAGSLCDEPVTSIDLYRTIAELAGTTPKLDGSQRSDGESIAGLLEKPASRTPREELYWHYPHYYPMSGPCSAIRQRDWKLIEFHETGRTELFRLPDDTSEQHDLAATNAAVATALTDKLHAWRKNVNVQMPTQNPKAPAAQAGR